VPEGGAPIVEINRTDIVLDPEAADGVAPPGPGATRVFASTV
jgi:hypothetical protein